MQALGKKPEADGKQFFYRTNLFSIQQEEDDMIISFNHDVTVRDDDLFPADNGANGRTLWQPDFVEAAANYL